MKAFPNKTGYEEAGRGMDLRDYFAAKALTGYVTGFKPNPLAQEAICERGYCRFENNAEAIAHSSYLLADAMIKAREETK